MCRHRGRRAQHPYAESQKDCDLLFVASPAYPGIWPFRGSQRAGCALWCGPP